MATIPLKIILFDLWNAFRSCIQDTFDWIKQTDWNNALTTLGVELTEQEISEMHQRMSDGRVWGVSREDFLKYCTSSLDTKYIDKFKALYHRLFTSIDRDNIKSKSLCCYQWRLPW